MLMTLGLFVWGLDSACYQELSRQTQWRHASSSRVGKRPANQFAGLGDDTMTLTGWIAPELAGSRLSLEELRMMGDKGNPYPLVTGNGEVLGLWILTALNEGQSLFYPNGEPRRISFNLSLKRVDDDQIDRVGLITNPRELLQ
ncbi:phage tail protein [Motiliproteus sp.]|uniref:phage tail protein n=1 Tax=Motiliproteus sp. TaxID=1898955 RepID=UPI003BAC98A2